MGAKEPPRLEGYAQGDEKTTPDVFEVSGSIKWFDPSRGYGFIVPDEDFPDILLHVTCLRRAGFQTAYEGARAICEVVRTPKGLQALSIRAMDDSTAIRPSQLPQRTHVVVVPESDWERAVAPSPQADAGEGHGPTIQGHTHQIRDGRNREQAG